MDLSPYATDAWDSTWDTFYDDDGTANDEDGWRTVLLGGNRLGGEEYFALDVTDASGFAALWDVVPFPGRKSSTMPVISKIKGGSVDKWAAVVTSGYHEGTGTGLIAALNLTAGGQETIWNDGTSDVSELSTQSKDAANPYYTLSSPAVLDSDNDGYLDLIYVGDTEGSLWKFYYDYIDQIWKKIELFDTGGQPITAKPVLVKDSYGKLRIYFGTGKYMVTNDRYNTSRNSFYVLVEQKTSSADANNGHYTSTTALTKTSPDLVDLTSTTNQTLFDAITAAEATRVNEKGYYFDLEDPGGFPAERVVEEALVIDGGVYFTSFLPNSDVCGAGGDSRMYAIQAKTGLPLKEGGISALDSMAADTRYIPLGEGIASKPVYYYDSKTKQGHIITQRSGGDIDDNDDPKKKVMSIRSWQTN